MEYFDASAKLDKGVKEVFECLLTQVYVKKNGGASETRETITMTRAASNEPTVKKKGCCK